MGGFGSGRTGGRPTTTSAKKIDLAWMLRKGMAREGQWISGTLSWNCGGQPAGSISYPANMVDPYASTLRLTYWLGSGEGRESVEQLVRLVFTVPTYGGRRWWMICPYSGRRVAKLYKPAGGDRFASRRSWRLGYQSQRDARRDRPFEKLFRLQRKLGSEQGWEAPLRRPKGMWQRTYERHLERYYDLDNECAVEMMSFVLRFRRDT
jgi:hypothetical protein